MSQVNCTSSDVTISTLYILPDGPDLVKITTDVPSDTTEVLEGSDVTIACSTDANPAPLLSVWKQSGDSETTEVEEAGSTSLYFHTTVAVTRDDKENQYFCRAVGETGSPYVKDSTMVKFTVKCEFLFFTLASCIQVNFEKKLFYVCFTL